MTFLRSSPLFCWFLLIVSLCLIVLCPVGVSGQSAGDSQVLGLLSRPPVVNLNFSTAPSVPTNWLWLNADSNDTSTNQAIHQGVAVLNGSTGAYIDISATATTAQGAYGVTLPSPYGGSGLNGSGWSVEMVVKFPTVVQNLAACLFLFQDAIDSWQTITWGNTFDAGDADSNNRLIATLVNNAASGVPTAAGGGHIEFFAPNPNTWYHMTWTVTPYPTVAAGTALWSIYINGVLEGWANALVPNSTLSPIQGASYPQPSLRTIANIGKDSNTNTFLVTVDAFRVYDYLLPAQTVASLANAYGMYSPTPAPTSYPFPASTEASAVSNLVPTPPIFSATFSVAPTTDPAIPYTNYQWASADPSDSQGLQSVHPGVVLLNGSALSYINLQQATGPQSCGLLLPIFGLPGSGTPGVNQGLTFEVVFKYPIGYSLSNGAKIFDFGQGGTETWDWAYQGTQIQFESQNNVAPGTESWSSGGYQSVSEPSTGIFATGVWYHVVATLANPSFSNWGSTLTVYVNGMSVYSVSPYNFPLPSYRPLAYLGGADYNNPNLPLTLDAFRIYDYALNSTTIKSLANLYVPPCAVVPGTSGGDFLVGALVPRAAVLNLNFTSAPYCTTGVQTNWLWAASDPKDSPANASIHQGVALLNGNTFSYIDVSATASALQGAGGATLPSPFGGRGYDGSGWSIEMVLKFPTVSENVAACLFLFQDALGSYMTITTGNDFDTGDVDSNNRVQITVINNAATGVSSNATGNSMEVFAPSANVWYHMAWTIQPYGSTGQAVWRFYVNGVLLNYANVLIPNSTFAPIQGAAYPQASNRTIATIGKDSGSNYYQVTVDAFRVYDYLLQAPTVTALANAYQLYVPPIPQTSYNFPASTEASAVSNLVPTPPIFSATFSVAPTTDPAIPYTNYQWASADPSDSQGLQSVHPGVVLLNGSALSYINLQQATGPQSCGLLLPIFGLPGSGTPGVNQGLTFEVVFKYPTGYTLSGGEKIFDFGQGGTETWDWAYQGSQIEFESQNNIGPGVLNGVSARQAPFWPSTGTLTVGVWQHVVMVLSNPSFVNYTAAWTLYINGTQVAAQNPSIFPLPIFRPLSFLGGADYNNPNLPLTLDAFRMYDYALSSNTVAQLYNTLYNPAVAAAPAVNGVLCYLTYSLPGNVDYPWSLALSLNITYNPNPVTNGNGTGYTILSGRGSHVFTNRFGHMVTTAVTVLPGITDNLIYTSSTTGTPFDSSGLTLGFASPVQLPGAGPTGLLSSVPLVGSGGAVVESGSYRVDGLGQVVTVSVPGFTSITIGASNINSLAVTVGVCAAPISFTNGLRAPTQPSSSNGASTFNYSYTISDGTLYQVQTNLTITCDSAFANNNDQLGNPFQTVTRVTGTRTYTYLPTSSVSTSTVTGLASTSGSVASQRWYPYILLASSPGVYPSVNTVPFVDADGILFTVSPAVPLDGNPVGTGTTVTSIRLFIANSNSQSPVLAESNYYVTLPQIQYQQQTYIL